jgi:hypothetical protein
MKNVPLKAFVVAFFAGWLPLACGMNAYAQNDPSANQEAANNNTQDLLNEIDAIQARLQQSSKRLNDLEEKVDENNKATVTTRTTTTTEEGFEPAGGAASVPVVRRTTQTETSEPENQTYTQANTYQEPPSQNTYNNQQTVQAEAVTQPKAVTAGTQIPSAYSTPAPTASQPSTYAGNYQQASTQPQAAGVTTASAQGAATQPAASMPNAASPKVTVPENTIKVSGYARAAMGIDSSGNAIFARANADLNERNWRLLSSSGLNNNINTYDPAIYSQLKVLLDATVAKSVLSFHLNLTADPWSYTAKSPDMLVKTQWGDLAKVQYLWWGNTGYTVNTTHNTLRLGGAFNLPEIKPVKGVVPPIAIPTTIGNQFGQTDIINITSMKLDYTFNPIREAWVDFKPVDNLKIRVFPMAYEDQAMTTDDPLKLSNNTEWWAESPWIDGWAQGNYNSGDGFFTKGQWDKSLSFLTRDSTGLRLTALRGASLSYDSHNENETTLNAEIASPKTLWQDYGDYSTVAGSARLKQFLGDKFYVGLTENMHLGYTTSERMDAENLVDAVDAGVRPLTWLKISGEAANSRSLYDITSPAYETKYNGNAFYGGIQVASPTEQDILRTDYFGMHVDDKSEDFFKSMFYFARMDKNFESSLSDYHFTRDDSFWSDDITFYPSLYRYMPGVTPSQSADDLAPFALGNGIDYGRTTLTWRADENVLDGKVHLLEDIRHVTDNKSSKNLQNIYRVGATVQPTDRFTTKILGIYDARPKTTAGVDPFVIQDNTAGTPFLNTAVPGGKDPSLKTASLGSRYQLTDKVAINGVWDYTNDIYQSSDNFPNGDLNSTFFSTYMQNGKTYTVEVPQLYDQAYFEQAPYPYHNIFKAGLEVDPTDKWRVYLDYTRNPNKFAGNIDDNMNHFGIETSYVPNPRLGFFARYTLSNGYDINRLVNDNQLQHRYWNNFFFEMRMVLPYDINMSLQYGVGPAYNVQTSATSPDLTYYSTTVVETQHIVRLVFDKKF